MDYGCRLYNKVSEPVKGKYLLLCMNSIMYFLLTLYALIMFKKVLNHSITKIKNFVIYFKKGFLKYFKISMIFLNISKWNISSFISTRSAEPWHTQIQVAGGCYGIWGEKTSGGRPSWRFGHAKKIHEILHHYVWDQFLHFFCMWVLPPTWSYFSNFTSIA